MKELSRRKIRYVCFRLQTEQFGGSPAKKDKEGPMAHVDEVKKYMEKQDGFGGWKEFAKSWDVSGREPWSVVARKTSIEAEWEKVIRKEAKDLPLKKAKERKKKSKSKK